MADQSRPTNPRMHHLVLKVTSKKKLKKLKKKLKKTSSGCLKLSQSMRIQFNSIQYAQVTINCPLHGVLIQPWCIRCPSLGARKGLIV